MIVSNHGNDPQLESALGGERALQRAWRDLCARYIREGRKMIVWRNNRVEHADPAELLAEADRTAQRDA